MLAEQIAKFIENEQQNHPKVKVDFKKRNTILGLFVQLKDYEELKAKNLWRLVSETNLEKWHKTKDINAVKMFNGGDFAKISLIKKKVVAPVK